MQRRLKTVLIIVVLIAVMNGACTKGNSNVTSVSSTVASRTKTRSSSPTSTTFRRSFKTTGMQEDTAVNGDVAEAVNGDVAETVEDKGGGAGVDTVAESSWGIVKGNVDLGGATIQVHSLTNAFFPADTPDKTPHYRTWIRFLNKAQEKYNCKFEFTAEPGSSATNMIQNLITASVSGIKYTDICRMLSSYQLPALIKSKAILPLNDYIDFETPIIKNNKYLYEGCKWEGVHYGILNEFKCVSWTFMYNKSILDRCGQPDILDLAEKDNWTWDTFLEIAKNCTRDLNGDGFIDQWGAATTSNWYLTKYMLFSNGLTSGVNVSDSGVEVIINTPPAIRTFQFISDLTFVHKVVKIDSTAGSANGVYMTGKAATLIYNWYGPNRTLIQQGADYVFMAPLPKEPDTEHYGNSNPASLYVLSSVCDKPAEKIQVFTEASILWTEDMKYVPEFYELGSDEFYYSPENPNRWMTTFREQYYGDIMTFEYFVPDFTEGFPAFATKMNSLIAYPIMMGEKGVMQAVDTALPVLQGIVDSVMK